MVISNLKSNKEESMKKLSWAALVMAFFFFVTPALARNSLLLRSQIENGDFKTFNIFGHHAEHFSIGSRVLTGPNDWLAIEPFAFLKLNHGINLGTRYYHDSSGNDVFGPGLRIIQPIKKKALLFFDFCYFLDTKGGKNRTDVLFSLTTMGKGWFIGTEVWHLHIRNSSYHTVLRPVKIGYRLDNWETFVMPGFTYKKGEADPMSSAYWGVVLKF